MRPAIDPLPGPVGPALAKSVLRHLGGRAPPSRQRQISGLMHLAEHILRDIGLTRSELADLDRPPRLPTPF